MGEHKLRAREQIDLFRDGSECRVVISRPERRPRSFPEVFRYLANSWTDKGELPLCFDRKCGNEVRSPQVYLLVLPRRNAQPLGMAVCLKCAAKSDDEILAILRDDLRSLSVSKADSAMAMVDVPGGAYQKIVGGIMTAVIDDSDSPEFAKPVTRFLHLLDDNKLSLLAALHGGMSNCFDIVSKLYQDLKALGIEKDFARKVGFANVVKNDGERMGLHNRVESDGWAIDCSNGGRGNPIWFMPVQKFYEMYKFGDVQDWEQWEAQQVEPH